MRKYLSLLLVPFLLSVAPNLAAEPVPDSIQPVAENSAAATPPLIQASDANDLKTVRQLLAQGANPNETDSTGFTALMAASNHGYTKIVELLLRSGADPNQTTSDDNSALLLASTAG